MLGNNILFLLVIASCSILGRCDHRSDHQLEAECEVLSSTGDPSREVQGTITFVQPTNGDTRISINLRGFNSSDNNTMHGLHIHQVGDTGNNCKNAMSHYNPLNTDHGDPIVQGDSQGSNETQGLHDEGESFQDSPHIGDLGNIDEDENGNVNIVLTSKVVKLNGQYSVLDRAIVIHAEEDDLGVHNNTGSMSTGNAGGRIACCVIKEKMFSATTTCRINILLALFPIMVAVMKLA